MALPQKSTHPFRLTVFEGLEDIGQIEKAFQSDLGIEEVIILLPDHKDLERLKTNSKYKTWSEDSRIDWIVGAETAALPSLFYHALTKRNRHFIMRASTFIGGQPSTENSNYFKIARQYFAETCGLIEYGRGYLESSLLALENTLANMNQIESNPGIDQLNGLFRGLPAVVVSTGPSLTKSLPFLKSIQDRCILISADASLKILLAAGIRPHLVCTIERDEGTLPFYENAMTDLHGALPHIATFSLTPRTVVNEMRGPLWFGYRNMSFFGFFEAQVPRGVVAAGHSVAHFCTRLARHLECSEVVLIGQDLAYDPENYSSHSQGFSYSDSTEKLSLESLQKKVEDRGEKLTFVEGNLQAQLPTSTFYLMFLREFESLVRDIGIPVRNATIGGAKIYGTIWGQLEEFSKNWNPIKSPIETLDQHHKNAAKEGHFDYEKFLKITNEPLTLLNQCSDILSRQKIHLLNPEARPLLLTLANELRNIQKKLLDDEIFKSLTLDLIGTRMVQVENSIAMLWDNDESSVIPYLKLVSEWFNECTIAIEKIRNLLLKTGR